jgi:hypothetical protein
MVTSLQSKGSWWSENIPYRNLRWSRGGEIWVEESSADEED